MSYFPIHRRAAVGCAAVLLLSLATYADDKYAKSKEPVFPAVEAGRALVYFARPDFTRLIPEPTFKVFVDATPVGWLPQRSYMAAQIEPGSHVVWGSMTTAKRFEFEAGKTYFVVVVEQYGSPNHTVVAAMWGSGNPEDVPGFVRDKKLSYVKPNAEELGKLTEEGAKKFGKQEKRAPEVHAAALPATFQNVWYRTGKRGLAWKAYDASGTLNVSNEFIEYKSEKENFSLSTKDVKSVSMDTFTGFVNSGDEAPWSMVQFNKDGADQIAAFSNRHEPGATEQIFLTLQSAVKPAAAVAEPQVTAAGAADSGPAPPAGVATSATDGSAPPPPPVPAGAGLPEGFVLYEGSKEQFTIAIPKGWAAFDQGASMRAQGMRPGRFDMIQFEPADVLDSPSAKTLEQVDSGEIPAFFLQKLNASDGMSCTGFSERAQKRAVDVIGKEAPYKGKMAIEPAHADAVTVGGCKGLRVRAKGQPASGSAEQTDAYFASDGKILYLFFLRGRTEFFDKNEEIFQKAMSSLKVASAK